MISIYSYFDFVDKCIEEFIDTYFDKSTLSRSSNHTLKEYVKHRLRKRMEYIRKKECAPQSYRVSKDILEKECNYLYDQYHEEVWDIMTECLELFKIKYELLNDNYRYSGSYHVKRWYSNQSKHFDEIVVSINMLNGYEENLAFAKSHIRQVRNLIKRMILLDETNRQYLNYMELYSLKVCIDHRIVARFKFKNELYSLLTEEE